MSTTVQDTTTATTSGTITTSTKPASDTEGSSALLASMIAMMEAIYTMEGNYATVMNEIATRQTDTEKKMTSWQIDQNKKLIHKIHRIARKMKKMGKWGKLEKIGAAIVVAASIAVAIGTAGAGTALVVAAIGVMSMLPAKNNPIDMAASELAKAMGGGEGAELAAKAIVIAAVVIVSCGAGAADGAAAGTSMSSSAETAAKLAAAQVLASLNPLADAMIGSAQLLGVDSSEVDMILTIVASVLTMVASAGLTISASGSNATNLLKDLVGENGLASVLKLMRGVEIMGAAMSGAGSVGVGSTQVEIGQIQFQQADIQKLLTTLTQVIKRLNSMSTDTMNASTQTQQGFSNFNQAMSQEVNQFDIAWAMA